VSKNDIKAFLEVMRHNHAEQIEGMDLPDGTRDYLQDCIASHDVGTLEFMLKLGYLMGLQTGFAAAQAGDGMPDGSEPFGPIQA
jgi:hypothetical protein